MTIGIETEKIGAMALPSPNNLDWHCEVSGSAQTPLVCVHGWCCEGGQFAELARRLEGDFRVYRPDLPGHGMTPLGAFAPGFEAYASVLAEWIAARNLVRPVLVGHSMGGVLSLMAADRIGARAVINLDGSLPAAPATLAGQAAIRGWLGEPDFRDRLAAALREGFFLPHERDARAEAVIRAMCAAPEEVLRFLPEKIGTIDAGRILSKVGMPVLYIGAENPRFDAGQASNLLPQLRVEQIRNTGHFLHLYAPGRVAELARNFLLNPTSTAGSARSIRP